MPHGDVGLLTNLAVSLAMALALGLATQRIGLSPIVGYLLAGFALGPQTPGFVADRAMAAQFAEIGVILLMFGVGLHFHVEDLLEVRKVALPGAIFQIGVATALAMGVAHLFGQGLETGLVTGIAVSVASTVVLVRVLEDNGVLQSSEGRIAIGWLIVEDVFTVLMLVLLPGIAGALGGSPQAAGDTPVGFALLIAILKVAGLTGLVLVVGRRVLPWLLEYVARSRSRELFTLTVLALALAIAMGSAVLFGVSVALGAFLAGMVVGQTHVSHQAAADALPMRDAFAVLFFVSVGMLFDPRVIAEQPGYVLSLLGIILLGKPLAALTIVWVLGYSLRTALTVSVALAQIGEFSFIVADLAHDLGILPTDGRSMVIACALVSIAINPLLFSGIGPLERWLRGRGALGRALTHRSEARALAANAPVGEELRQESAGGAKTQHAIVVGFGPVGRSAASVVRELGLEPVVIDLNVDTVQSLRAAGAKAVYGDAARREILERAGVADAACLLVTIPDQATRSAVVMTARRLSPSLRIFVRSRYLKESEWLEKVGATAICSEEEEVAAGLARLVAAQLGTNERSPATGPSERDPSDADSGPE
jgi:CPA2 family monovalent cation:H+ antiporter-2